MARLLNYRLKPVAPQRMFRRQGYGPARAGYQRRQHVQGVPPDAEGIVIAQAIHAQLALRLAFLRDSGTIRRPIGLKMLQTAAPASRTHLSFQIVLLTVLGFFHRIARLCLDLVAVELGEHAGIHHRPIVLIEEELPAVGPAEFAYC